MLINFDDLTILGQGSEWFWTMLTMIALSVTFVAIYRQLRAQHAAVAFEQVQSLTKERESERMRYDCLRLAIGLRRGDDLEELEPFLGITDFYEKVSFLTARATSARRCSTSPRRTRRALVGGHCGHHREGEARVRASGRAGGFRGARGADARKDGEARGASIRDGPRIHCWPPGLDHRGVSASA